MAYHVAMVYRITFNVKAVCQCGSGCFVRPMKTEEMHVQRHKGMRSLYIIALHTSKLMLYTLQ